MFTTTCTVMRGTVLSPWGSQLASQQPVQHLVPFGLFESQVSSISKETGRQSTTRTVTATCPNDTDVRQGDRLRDELTGTVYDVLDVSRNSGALFASVPMNVTLRQVEEEAGEQ